MRDAAARPGVAAAVPAHPLYSVLLGRILSIALQEEDLHRALRQLLEDLGRILEADRCGIILRLPADGDRDCIAADLSWSASGIHPLDGAGGPFRRRPIFDAVVSRNETLHIENCMSDRRAQPLQPAVDELDIATWLVVPMVVEDRVRGILDLQRCGAPRSFSPDQVGLAREVAGGVALSIGTRLAVERDRHGAARDDERDARRSNQLQILHRVQSGVTRLADPLELAQSAADTIRRAMPDISVTVSLIDPRKEELIVQGRAGGGALQEEVPRIALADRTRGAAEVARTGVQLLVPDVKSEAGGRLAGSGAASILHVPILFKQEILGVLTIEASRPHAFGGDDEATFQAVAAVLGTSLDNARLFEKVEQEKKEWAATFDAITDMVSVHDREFRLLRCNQALVSRAGVPAYALTGRTCSEIYSGIIGTGMDCPHEEAERTRRPASREIERPGVGVFRLTALPAFETGSITYAVHLCEDVTGEKRLREQLLQSEKMSAVGQLVSGVAHELNNPLAGIMGYTQLMMTRPIESKLRGELERVFSEAQRAAKIVQNLLTFARKHKPERRYLGVNGIVEKTLELRAYQLRVSNIEVRTDLDPRLPRTMLDFHQLQQVILNILTNAEQAMLEAHGRGRLIITTRSHGDRIELRIQDDGPGIAPEHLSRIFDPFFTTKPVGQGTGLGLAICHGIVKEHGGTLGAESVAGQGATFIVDLPILLAEQPPQTAGTAAPSATPASGRSILVVDDEAAIQDLLVEILTQDGYRVDTAGGGASALVKIEGRAYDLIISDLKMPGISGAELYERIRSRKPELASRVLFTSGDTVSGGIDDFLRRTGSAALLKPFTIDDLHAALRRFFPPSS